MPPSIELPASSNLPAEMSSFVGRRAELAELQSRLRQSRLVTLCGSGGCGKTRLAVQVARGWGAELDAGVCFCDLSAVIDPALVPGQVADVLGVREVPGVSALDLVVARLADAHLLLLLDNCEHVIGAAAELAEAVLRACPRVVVLATSREPLGIEGETAYRVPSLDMDDAVELFCERASAAQPNFAVTPDNAAAVEEICRRLDGIPLAIELAAARVRVLTPAQIAAGLADRFRLLGRGRRTALARQQTLHASVAWSHDLLNEPQRVLLRRVSVFAGAFDLDAVEAVCSGDGIELLDVLDLLAQLVDRSLVVAEQGSSTMRYRLLETIREFARDRLVDAAEAEAVQGRHLCHYATVAQRLSPLFVSDQPLAIRCLEEDRDNFLAALEWAVDARQPEPGMRLVAALLPAWLLQGRYAEGRRWAETLDTLPGEDAHPTARAGALLTLAVCASMQTDVTAALDAGRAALALARRAGHRTLEARCLSRVGYDMATVDADAGVAVLEESVAVARDAGDAYTVALSSMLLGWYLFMSRGPDAGRVHLLTAITTADGADDGINGVYARVLLCHLELRAGRPLTAQEHGRAARERLERMHEVYWSSVVESGIAEALLTIGETEQAAELATAAEALARTVPATMAPVPAAMVQALVAVRRGAPDAVKRCRDASDLCHRYGPWMGSCLRQWTTALLAVALDDRGEWEAARRAVDEALNTPTAGAARCTPLVVAARFAGEDGDPQRAEALAHEALALALATGWRVVVPDVLEVLAGLDVDEGNGARAVRLLGGAAACRQESALTGWRWSAAVDRDLARARSMLGAEAFAAEWAAGQRLSADGLVALVTRGRGRRGRPASGWPSLTPTEQTVVDLVCEGLSNKEIAVRLLVSRRTVDTHLTHVYAKLGVGSRTELVSLALRRSLTRT